MVCGATHKTRTGQSEKYSLNSLLFVSFHALPFLGVSWCCCGGGGGGGGGCCCCCCCCYCSVVLLLFLSLFLLKFCLVLAVANKMGILDSVVVVVVWLLLFLSWS